MGTRDIPRRQFSPRGAGHAGGDVARGHCRRDRGGAGTGRTRGRTWTGAGADDDRHRRWSDRRGAGRERARRNTRRTGYPQQRHAQLHQHGGRRSGRAGPCRPMNGKEREALAERPTGSSAARAYLDLGRPFTLVAPALGFISGALTAVGAAPREAWTAGLLVPPILGSLMAATLNAGNNALNQIYDLEIDRVNKPKRPLPSGRLSVAQAWRFSVVTYAASLVLAWLVAPGG